jgi:uncharacterized protein involved in response to NO
MTGAGSGSYYIRVINFIMRYKAIPWIKARTMTALFGTQIDPDRPVSPDGLKPSFFTGALWAGLLSLVALPVGFGSTEVGTAYTPADWYAHEGLYGYLAAIITGFLLGTPRQQTQRPPLPGLLLVVLILAWLAGRLAILGSATISAVVAGAVDSVFLVLAAALAVRVAFAARDRAVQGQAAVLVALAAGNVMFHLGLPEPGKRIGIAAVVLLVTLASGRPAARGGEAASFDYVDIAAVSLSALALLAWIVLPGLMVTGILLLLAGLAQAVRLVGWIRSGAGQGSLTLAQQIAYGLIPLGFLALGSAAFDSEPPGPANIRAWLVGAVGTLALAMVIRADLTQADRPALVRIAAYVIYGAVGTAIGLRLFTGWIPVLVPVAGAAWVIAFAVFVLGYMPLLARPRVTAP